jgi:AcrR family transcriptional regulator
VADAFTREALAIEVDQGIKGKQVVEAMTQISVIRGAPETIRVDNGPEFISKGSDRWVYENGVALDLSQPGKPTDNPVLSLSKGTSSRALTVACATSALPSGSPPPQGRTSRRVPAPDRPCDVSGVWYRGGRMAEVDPEVKPRQRRTQEQRRTATRAALLSAAIRCLDKHGYGATTTVAVAAEAGVSRGAMLHHFPSKADLMLAVVEHVMDLNSRYFEAERLAIGDPWERYAAMPDLRWQLALQPHGNALMEIMVGARSDEVVRERYGEFQERLSARQGRRLAERAAEAGLSVSEHDRAVSRAIVFAIRGLAIEKQIAPDLDPEPVMSVLRELKRRTMGPRPDGGSAD